MVEPLSALEYIRRTGSALECAGSFKKTKSLLWVLAWPPAEIVVELPGLSRTRLQDWNAAITTMTDL